MKDRTIGEQIRITDIIFWIIRGIWVILLMSVLFAAAGYVYASQTYIPTYTATASMVVNAKKTESDVTYQDDASEIYLAQKLVSTYTAVIKSNRVMHYVQEDLSLNIPVEALQSYVSLLPLKDTQVLYLTVTCQDPQMAMNIANSVMKVAPQAMMETVERGSVNVLDAATLPQNVNPKNTTKYAVIGGAAGFLLGILIVLLAGFLSSKIKNGQDVEASLELSTLGELPHVRNVGNTSKLLISNPALQANYTESLLTLGAVAQYITASQDIHRLIITSSIENEGKTTICANLALALAKSGKKVLIIDCDFHNPSIHKLFSLPNTGYCILDVLAGKTPIAQAITKLPSGVDVLPCFRYTNTRAEKAFTVAGIQTVMNALDTTYDCILFDTPPATIVSDTIRLTKIADAAILVVRQNYSTVKALTAAVESLQKVGTKILGCVLNDIRYSNIGTQNYGKYRSYYSKKYYGNKKHKYYGNNLTGNVNLNTDEADKNGQS